MNRDLSFPSFSLDLIVFESSGRTTCAETPDEQVRNQLHSTVPCIKYERLMATNALGPGGVGALQGVL